MPNAFQLLQSNDYEQFKYQMKYVDLINLTDLQKLLKFYFRLFFKFHPNLRLNGCV